MSTEGALPAAGPAVLKAGFERRSVVAVAVVTAPGWSPALVPGPLGSTAGVTTENTQDEAASGSDLSGSVS